MSFPASLASSYMDLLHQEIQIALGCTEPAAVAFCAATAAESLKKPVFRLAVEASPYILKNAMHVGIPGAKGLSGAPIAAAIGSLLQQSERKLEIFEALTDEMVGLARSMVDEGRVTIRIAQNDEKVWIDTRAFAFDGSSARAVVQGDHTHILLVEREGKTLHAAAKLPQAQTCGPRMMLRDIYTFCMTTPPENLACLEDVIRLNGAVAQRGLEESFGLQVGRMVAQSRFVKGDTAVAMTAAAVDARMDGCMMPVMTNMGSGNQGLTASVPLIATAWAQGSSHEQLLRALAMSELVAMDVKANIGRLSALCGCGIAAGIGAAAGMVVLYGGTYEQVLYAIQTMAADVAGMVCDGAKPGCALKVATAVSSAQRAASLAMSGERTPGHFGIVSHNVEKTLANLGKLGDSGMGAANGEILRMLMEETEQVGKTSRECDVQA